MPPPKSKPCSSPPTSPTSDPGSTKTPTPSAVSWVRETTPKRVVSYRDGEDFAVNRLIRRCIWEQQQVPVGFVSFENECILSIYDDRGCDIVFATHEKLRELYSLLKPFFLEYDAGEMARRYAET